MTFRVGQKVVCVRDDWSHPQVQCIRYLPVKGAIYRIRGIFENPGGLGLVFDEIRNPTPAHWLDEPNFHAIAFRPLVERPNDGEAFVENLKRLTITSPEREGVDA